MAAMYSWTFKNLRVVSSYGDLNDVAISVDYRLAYTADESRWVYHGGTATFAAPDPDNFIDLEDITESTMVDFVESALGAELDTIKTALEDAYTNPVEQRPLPWVAAAAARLDAAIATVE